MSNTIVTLLVFTHIIACNSDISNEFANSLSSEYKFRFARDIVSHSLIKSKTKPKLALQAYTLNTIQQNNYFPKKIDVNRIKKELLKLLKEDEHKWKSRLNGKFGESKSLINSKAQILNEIETNSTKEMNMRRVKKEILEFLQQDQRKWKSQLDENKQKVLDEDGFSILTVDIPKPTTKLTKHRRGRTKVLVSVTTTPTMPPSDTTQYTTIVLPQENKAVKKLTKIKIKDPEVSLHLLQELLKKRRQKTETTIEATRKRKLKIISDTKRAYLLKRMHKYAEAQAKNTVTTIVAPETEERESRIFFERPTTRKPESTKFVERIIFETQKPPNYIQPTVDGTALLDNGRREDLFKFLQSLLGDKNNFMDRLAGTKKSEEGKKYIKAIFTEPKVPEELESETKTSNLKYPDWKKPKTKSTKRRHFNSERKVPEYKDKRLTEEIDEREGVEERQEIDERQELQELVEKGKLAETQKDNPGAFSIPASKLKKNGSDVYIIINYKPALVELGKKGKQNKDKLGQTGGETTTIGDNAETSSPTNYKQNNEEEEEQEENEQDDDDIRRQGKRESLKFTKNDGKRTTDRNRDEEEEEDEEETQDNLRKTEMQQSLSQVRGLGLHTAQAWDFGPGWWTVTNKELEDLNRLFSPVSVIQSARPESITESETPNQTLLFNFQQPTKPEHYASGSDKQYQIFKSFQKFYSNILDFVSESWILLFKSWGFNLKK